MRNTSQIYKLLVSYLDHLDLDMERYVPVLGSKPGETARGCGMGEEREREKEKEKEMGIY
jgi:hypothetical protein